MTPSVTSRAALKPLSIRTRLNLMIGALLVLALAANVLAIVWSAGPRIRAENDSIVTLTRHTIESELATSATSTDPARELASLLDRLTNVRHASITFEADGGPPVATTVVRSARRTSGVPGWFLALVTPERPPVRIPVAFGERHLGTIVIAPRPGDEIAEIWSAVKATAVGGLALIAAVYALTTLAVRHALAPIDDMGRALGAMTGGNYAVKLATTGPPELAAISSKVNDLAVALARTTAGNRRLAGELVNLEDRERRELARELHDEFGPYLFAIRANVTALLAASERAQDGVPLDLGPRCHSALDHIEALQQVNRRVLQRLRPPALAELGLPGALSSLVGLWLENHPQVAVSLEVELGGRALDDTTGLTVYRVVQEGLTNAFRHAKASSIAVRVRAEPQGPVRINVADNGQGIAAGHAPGFGLSGMAERVWALGGEMQVAPRPDGGTQLAVELPAAAFANGPDPRPAT